MPSPITTPLKPGLDSRGNSATAPSAAAAAVAAAALVDRVNLANGAPAAQQALFKSG